MNRQINRAEKTSANHRNDMDALDMEPSITHSKRKRNARRASRRANKQIVREAVS